MTLSKVTFMLYRIAVCAGTKSDPVSVWTSLKRLNRAYSIMFFYNVSSTCCKVNDLFPSSMVNVKHCVETVLLQKISFPNNYAVETLLVLKKR